MPLFLEPSICGMHIYTETLEYIRSWRWAMWLIAEGSEVILQKVWGAHRSDSEGARS